MTDALTPLDTPLREALKRDEGVRNHAYPDPLSGGDPWTNGVGSTKGVKKGDVWSLDDIEAHLTADIHDVLTGLDRDQPWFRNMTLPRQRALANMAFNLGIRGVDAFHNTMAAMRAADYVAAAAGMRASAWDRQVHARAERLAHEIEAG